MKNRIASSSRFNARIFPNAPNALRQRRASWSIVSDVSHGEWLVFKLTPVLNFNFHVNSLLYISLTAVNAGRNSTPIAPSVKPTSNQVGVKVEELLVPVLSSDLRFHILERQCQNYLAQDSRCCRQLCQRASLLGSPTCISLLRILSSKNFRRNSQICRKEDCYIRQVRFYSIFISTPY